MPASAGETPGRINGIPMQIDGGRGQVLQSEPGLQSTSTRLSAFSMGASFTARNRLRRTSAYLFLRNYARGSPRSLTVTVAPGANDSCARCVWPRKL